MTNSKKSIILVTGGTGLVGSHLLYELTSKGLFVRALCRKTSNIEQVRKVFSFYTQKVEEFFSHIEWFEGDILDIVSLNEAMQDIEYVYHVAAFVSFNPREKKNILYNNIKGTENVVNACLENNIKKLCHVSSIASLGKTDDGSMVSEENYWVPTKLHSTYSQSKYYSENEVWRGIAEGLNAVIVNPSVILGPGDWNRSSGALFSTIKKGLSFYTSGATGYVDVVDVVRIMLQLMNSNISGERFILNGDNCSFKDIFYKIALSVKATPPKREAPRWLAEMGWRVVLANYYLTGKTPSITRETVQSGYGKTSYSSEKIKKALGVTFNPIDETIARVGRIYSLE